MLEVEQRERVSPLGRGLETHIIIITSKKERKRETREE